jgi:hypothetical protein
LLQQKAPNLTLNIDRAIPKPKKVLLFTCLGLFIQAIVMAANAIAVYYLRWPQAGFAVAAYGYPVRAIGTLCISLGVTICARVVQRTTVRFTLGPGENSSPDGLRVVRLQDRIADFDTPVFAIIQSKDNQQIRVSIRVSRLNEPSTRTMIGAVLTMAGFVCQNIGTRELHWSAGVLQLGTTLSLAVIRALLRRHVGDKPKPEPVSLQEGMESSALATHLELSGCGILSERWMRGSRVIHDFLDKGKTSLKTGFGKGQVIHNGKNITRNHGRRTSREARLKILRMLVLQYELSRWVPERKEILELTDGLCKAMEDTHRFLLGNASPLLR